MSDSAKYSDKIVLAPMVRVGTLPMRILSLQLGSDLCYSEELIDYLVVDCKRRFNPVLGTTDFYSGGNLNDVVFRTCPAETAQVVFQMGTCDPERALAVGKLVQEDVSGVDVNMGCPKAFSLSGGMGAALLTKPLLVKNILSTLVDGLHIPVTCKIRLFDKIEDTLELCKVIERTGVSALAVHGRTKEQRPRHPNNYEAIRTIAQAMSIPVIANGCADDVTCFDDVAEVKRRTGCSSVMLARSAMRNCSVFRPEGLLPVDDIIRMYLRLATEYGNDVHNTKYVVQQMLREHQTVTERGRTFMACSTLREMCDLFDLSEEYGRIQAIHRDRKARLERSPTISLGDADDVVTMNMQFLPRFFGNTTPKQVLYEWTRQQRMYVAIFDTSFSPADKRFSSTVTVNGHKYRSSFGEKSKKHAEQASALVVIEALDLWHRLSPSAREARMDMIK